MEESPELRQIITGWFEAVERGDTSWLDRHLSREANTRLIGTDPNEWLQGERIDSFLRGDVEALAGVNISVPEVEAFSEGTVGWGVARLVITLPDGGEFSPRWSAVFHQEDGEWKAVQVHASVGVPNEEALGMELPG